MGKTTRALLGIAVIVMVFVLSVAGERFAPPAHAPTGGDFKKQKCDVDAPQPLHAAAKEWCSSGLFVKITVTTNDTAVIGAAQFTPNGAQTWELQRALLIGDFRRFTEELAAAAGGRDVGISINDAGDRRVGACAKTTKDAAATCGTQ